MFGSLGLGLPYRGAGGGAWTPASLFAASEAGAWYDPSDLSTLWLDTAGTSPVTADGDPVARQDDKSGNGNHRTQATSTKRPLYRTDGTSHWLEWDGVDDALATAAIDFTGTAAISTFAGIYKASDAVVGMFLETSTSTNSNAGAFYVVAPKNTTTRFATGARGSAGISDALEAATDSATYDAPSTVVLSGLHDIAGDSSILRLNGVQVDEATADKGTGNFGNYPLYTGSRAGSSLPFNGNDYGIIVRGVASTAQEIADAEAYLAGKSGVTL